MTKESTRHGSKSREVGFVRVRLRTRLAARLRPLARAPAGATGSTRCFPIARQSLAYGGASLFPRIVGGIGVGDRERAHGLDLDFRRRRRGGPMVHLASQRDVIAFLGEPAFAWSIVSPMP